MEKKISTRGRKREAKRWIQETKQRIGTLPPWMGNPVVYAQTPPEERSFERWSTAAALASLREWEQLRARDPALHAAVTELEYEGDRKFSALTPDQRYAQFMRRVDKQQREKRRAQRQAQSQKPR